MNNIQLSQRLEKVSSYIPQGAFFADIGSDHAYLPCYVCLNDPTTHAIAGEVNQGPYQAAVNQVNQQELQSRIEVRKGDGLAVLKPKEVEQITIAGMGGKLIRTILDEGKDKLGKVNRIITQPNIDAKVIREWLIQHHFTLVYEDILEEDGHIYEILVADYEAPNSPYTENIDKELLFGPFLMERQEPAFLKKWEHEREKLRKITQQMKQASQPDEEKIKQFQDRIQWIEEVIDDE